jgi:hypothetical protein
MLVLYAIHKAVIEAVMEYAKSHRQEMVGAIL